MDFINVVERLGSLGLLVCLIIVLPSIVRSFVVGVQSVINEVQKVHQEAIAHSDNQLSRIVTEHSARFASIEAVLQKNIETTQVLIREISLMKERVTNVHSTD